MRIVCFGVGLDWGTVILEITECCLWHLWCKRGLGGSVWLVATVSGGWVGYSFLRIGLIAGFGCDLACQKKKIPQQQ